MTYVWGVAFGKDIGAEKTPHSSSAQCVSTFYALFALIVVNTYCANLMAFLVQENFELPINGIRDAKVTLRYIITVQILNSDYQKYPGRGGQLGGGGGGGVGVPSRDILLIA